jgi:uracil-DNA glycosylase
MGSGPLGAHGTRIPFGGDIAGANLEVLLSSIGLDRNRTFIAASLNQLPKRGGGEPTSAELKAPVGDYPTSLHIVRDTIVAVGPELLIALGNVALRVCFSALRAAPAARNLPSVELLHDLGLVRNTAVAWPSEWPLDDVFLNSWRAAWAEAPLPHILWLTHPSAQNMSPYAGRETVFHSRMVEARNALQSAVRDVLDWQVPEHRPVPPVKGIYALPEWQDLIAPRLGELDRLWRDRGV